MITNAKSSESIINTIWEVVGEHIYELNAFDSRDIRRYGLKKLIVNGYWVAYVQSRQVQTVAHLLRTFRRENPHEWQDVTVYVNESLELFVYSDFGRILNPMIIVFYDSKGEPYTKLTPQNVEYILAGKARIDWLLEEQIIEYVSVEESHNCLVAEDFAQYTRYKQPEFRNAASTRYNYTHILIP